MSITFDYYTHLERSITKDVTTEIQFYQNNHLTDMYFVADYVKYLGNRIYNVDLVCINKYDKFGGQIEMKKMNVNEYSKDLDLLVYKREWVKLKEFHKKKKIMEYINNLPYDPSISQQAIAKNRKFLFNAISKGMLMKRFKKGHNTINYNKAKMQIDSIECIVIDDDTKTYKVEWS